MRHAAHVALEAVTAFLLLAVFAVVNPPREVVLSVAVSLLVILVFVGAFRIWR